MISRRGLLGGLLALSAPAIIRTPGLLMPIRPLPVHALERWVIAIGLNQYGEEVRETLQVSDYKTTRLAHSFREITSLSLV